MLPSHWRGRGWHLLGLVCTLTSLGSVLGFEECPVGWQRTSNGSCFLLVTNQERVTWENAERFCVSAGGHLVSAANAQEFAAINATCVASSPGGSCWIGGKQLDNQATPSAGWFWQDCMTQQAAPWATLIPSKLQWRAGTPGEPYTVEPNDYRSVTDFGVEKNSENCAKLVDMLDGRGPQLVDYACSVIQDLTPTSFICAKSNYCGLNATSVYATTGCQCVCLPSYAGDGQACGLCGANAEVSYSLTGGVSRCICKAGFTGDGFTCRNVTAPCLPNAEFVRGPDGRFGCACRTGLSGSADNCTADDANKREGGKKSGLVVVAVVVPLSVAALLLACCVVGLVVYKRRRVDFQDSGFFAFVSPKPTPRRWSHHSTRQWRSSQSQSGAGSIVIVDIQNSGVASYTWRELSRATQNFSDATLLGTGGYGDVYKAVWADGRVAAVKRAKAGSRHGTRELRAEVELLSRLHHAHLLQLKGFCLEKGEQLLVYEYMSQGTLRAHLSPIDGSRLLSWYERLNVALGAAQGLDYLHTGADPPVIHRDVKSSNILLDENMVAKVADFGLSKSHTVGPYGHLSTIIRGTPGYLDPEYCETQQLTDRSDVYSFGVVLLEIITGRQVMDLTRPEEEWYLIRWARPHLQAGEAVLLLDPAIKGEPTIAALNTVAEVTALCLSRESRVRPSMSIVVGALSEALDIEDARLQATS